MQNGSSESQGPKPAATVDEFGEIVSLRLPAAARGVTGATSDPSVPGDGIPNLSEISLSIVPFLPADTKPVNGAVDSKLTSRNTAESKSAGPSLAADEEPQVSKGTARLLTHTRASGQQSGKYAPYGIDIETLGVLNSCIGDSVDFKLHNGKVVSGEYAGVYLKKKMFFGFDTVHVIAGNIIPHKQIVEWSAASPDGAVSVSINTHLNPRTNWNEFRRFLKEHSLRLMFNPPKAELVPTERTELESKIGQPIEILTSNGRVVRGEFIGISSVGGTDTMFLKVGREAEQYPFPAVSKYSFAESSDLFPK